jgi:uncharacterized protein YjbI with pentapeptide repeats
MKVVKPMAVSFSFRTFRVLGEQRVCATSLIGFRLGAGVRRLVSDVALWPAIGEAVRGTVDEGLPKPCGEVLVHGSCHAPAGCAVPSAMVRVRVAAAGSPPEAPAMVDKRLAVFGDRYWLGSASRGPTDDPVPYASQATAAVPFTEMPLRWDRAFGGPDYAKNPLGRGVGRIETVEGIWRVALPNVEAPSRLVTSSSERPDPAGLGPIDLSWPQRQSLAGTYDRRWLEEDFPGFARDTDPAFFNAAPADQRARGYFRGDEEYVLQNMHPSAPVLCGRLPRAAARVLLQRRGSADLEDLRMTLDTLVLLPDKDIGILVFRGAAPILEDDASDIGFALAACEDLDAPRPAEQYKRSLDERLDKDRSPLLALNEDDLLPSFAAGTGLADVIGKLQDPTKERRQRVFARAIERARERLAEAKVPNADALLAKMTTQAKPAFVERLERLPDIADPKDLAEYAAALDQFDGWAEAQRTQTRQSAVEQVDQARRRLDEQLDRVDPRAAERAESARREATEKLDALRRTLKGEALPEGAPPTGQGPPKPLLPKVLEMHGQANLEPDPKLVQLLERAQGKAAEMYRRSAHYGAPARLLDEDARARARSTVASLRAAGGGFAELDWTRYDLSELDLQDANCRKTLLEGADLTRTSLARADLSGAVLAHAVLHETRFDGAALEGTNLGATVVDGARFDGAKLRGAVFARSKLGSVSFRGADLTGTDWLEAELGAVDFEGALAEEMTFLYAVKAQAPSPGGAKERPASTDLTRCRFPKAKLRKANFLHSRLDGVDFTEADLELATLLSVKADGAIFRGARLHKLHAVAGCSFEGACFEGADLRGAFLRGSSLRGASFVGACLDGADLSECDLTGAALPGVRAADAFFIRSDLTRAELQGASLMRSMLQKSKLYGADLSRSNLFAANLALVRTDTATRVDGANLKRALMLPAARKDA